MISGNLLDGGFSLQYGENGTLTYMGGSAQMTTDVELPEEHGPRTLINNNERRLVLHASRTIDHVILNSKLDAGSNTLTTSDIFSPSSSQFVVTEDGGSLKILDVGDTAVLFPVGTTSYSPVWITNVGTHDDIEVGVIKDAEPAANGGRVRAKWTIVEGTAGGGDYTLMFGWTTGLEEKAFRDNQERDAKIYNLSEATEAGSGSYTTQFAEQPHTVSRSGISTLGVFVVGNFGDLSDVSEVAGLPTQFALNQNYPNPFNPTTRIEFSLPQKSAVQIVITNLLGEQVKKVVNKEFAAGNHSVTFDAAGMASGLYFYTLKTKEFVKTRKMMLMR